MFMVDCSQSPIFPWSRRDQSLSSSGRHLGSLRGLRTKGREGEVECEREARREREKRSFGALPLPSPLKAGHAGYQLGFCMRAKPHGHFVLSPGFARIQKPRWRPLELNDRSLRLHGKIGDCEQSMFMVMFPRHRLFITLQISRTTFSILKCNYVQVNEK